MANDFNDKIIKEFRDNNGRVGGMFDKMQILLLTTIGSKSGDPHTTPVAYTKTGDDYVVIASYAGGPNNPAWYNNLVKNPVVTVEVDSEKFSATARVAGPEERDRLYTAHASVYPTFLDYEKKTDRKIPAVVLKRNAGE